MIKPQQINEDGLPVLKWKENEDGLPVLPVKKKISLGEAGAKALLNGTSNTATPTSDSETEKPKVNWVQSIFGTGLPAQPKDEASNLTPTGKEVDGIPTVTMDDNAWWRKTDKPVTAKPDKTPQEKLQTLGLNVIFQKPENFHAPSVTEKEIDLSKPEQVLGINNPTFVDLTNIGDIAWLIDKVEKNINEGDKGKMTTTGAEDTYGKLSDAYIETHKGKAEKLKYRKELLNELSDIAAKNATNEIIKSKPDGNLTREDLLNAGRLYTKQVARSYDRRNESIVKGGEDLGDENRYNLEKIGATVLMNNIPDEAKPLVQQLNAETDLAHPKLSVAKGWDIIGAYNHKKDNNANNGWWRTRPSLGQVQRWLEEPELKEMFVGNEIAYDAIKKDIQSGIEKLESAGFAPTEAKATDVPIGGFFNRATQAIGGGLESIGNIFNSDAERQKSNLNPTLRRGSLTGNYSLPGQSAAIVQQKNALEDKMKDVGLTDEEQKEYNALVKTTEVRDGWDKFLDASGDVTGQVVMQALLTKGTGLGLRPLAGAMNVSKIPMAVNAGIPAALISYDPIKKQAVYNFPDDEAKQNIYTGTMVLANVLSERLFQDEKVLKAFTNELKKDVTAMLTKLSAKEISKAEIKNLVTDKILSYGKNFVKEGNKESLEEAIVQFVDEAAQYTLGAEDYKGENAVKNIGDTYLTTLLSIVPVSALAARSNVQADNFNSVGLYKMSLNPETYKDKVEKMYKDGDITNDEKNEKIKILNTAALISASEPPKIAEKNTKERAEYLVQTLNARLKTAELETTPDKNQQKEIREEIKISEERAAEIYDSTEEVKPEIKKANDQWKNNIVAIEERTDISDEEKEKLKTAEDTRHAEEVATLQKSETVTPEQELLKKIKSSKEVAGAEQEADLQYFIDKTGEAPLEATRRFGKDVVKELLPKVATEKLQENYKFLSKIDPESKEALELDRILTEREVASQPTGKEVQAEVPTVENEKKAIEEWLNNSDEHSDFVSFDWDGKVLEIFKSRDKAPVEFDRKQLEEEGVNFPEQKPKNENTQASPDPIKPVEAKKEIPTMGEAKEGGEGTGEAKKGFSSKARELAAKIRKEGLNAALPDWAKADLPEGTKQAGFGGKSLDNAIAKAIELVADAVDAGKEIAEAIKEGYAHLKDYYSQNTKSFDEEQIRADFTNNINKIFEIPERKVTEDQQAGLSGIKKALVSKGIIEGVDLNKIGDKEMMALGRKIIDSGEVKPEALVEKIITEKQGVLTPAEVVALITYKADIDNALRNAYTQANEKKAAGEDEGTLNVEIKDLERQVDDFDVAAIITAQQQSMAFRLRKMMLDRDYNLVTQIEKYKKNNNGFIPAEVEARFRELDKELKGVKDKLAKAEKKEVEKQEQEAVDNIKEDVERNGTNYTDEEIAAKIQEGIQKEIDAIHEKLPVEKKRASDKAIAALERFQKKLRGKAYSDVGGFVAILDAGVTTIKNAIKAGVAIIDAVELGISKIKKLIGSDKWEKENEFRQDMIDGFEAEGVSTKKKLKDTPTINDDGTVSIPNDMLRDLVARGITDIEGLTDAVHEKLVKQLPGITKRQVRDYITEYGKTINPTADELQKQVNTAKRVGRLISELEDLENKKKRETNPANKEKITEKERELKRQIKSLSNDIPLTEEEKATNLVNTKERVKQRIKELETRIKNKDFSKKKKLEPVKDDELVKLNAQKEKIQEEFDNAQYKNELKNRTFWQKAEDVAKELVSAVPRALVASIDFSAPFVQGVWRFFSQPIKSFKAMGDMFSQFWSEKNQEEWMNKLKSKPFYPLLQASKLAISDKEGKASVKEGLFISNWINLIYDYMIAPAAALPISIFTKGNVRRAVNIAQNINPYKASQRAFDGYVNSIRVQAFISLAKQLEKQGYTFEADPKVFEKAGDFVNTTTGRGGIGALEKSSSWLNILLFAPRKVVSEIKLFTPYAFVYYAKMPPAVRKRALLNFATFVTSFVATNALLWAARKDWDDDDEDDNFWNMNSSDFMTHKVGNQRIGFGGGAKTSLVFMSRLVSGKFTDQYGKTTELGDRFGKQINTRLDLAFRFALGKAAPAINVASKKLDEKKGLEVDDAELVKNITVPIWMQDAGSLYKDNPAAIGGMFTALSILGANVRTVDPSKSSVKTFKIYQKNGNKVREATPEEDKKYKTESNKLYDTELEKAVKGQGWGYNKYGELTIDDNDIEKKGSFKDLDDADKKQLQKRLKSSASAKAKEKIKY